MNLRNLGNSELQVSPLMLGGNVFGWTADEDTSYQILDAFVDRGFNFIDTADVYSRWVPGHTGGESETVIGNWIKRSGKREKVVLATKVGMEMPDGKGLSKDHILRSVEASLKRLQTDRIDLYQSHRDDPDTNFEETFEAYSQLIREGKIRVIGASNYSGERLKQSLDVSKNGNLPAYQCLQPSYNLYDRADYETNLEPVVTEYGLGVTPYFPYGQKVSERSRISDSEGPGPGCAAVRCSADQSGACVAYGKTYYYRPDCERNQPAAVGGFGRFR